MINRLLFVLALGYCISSNAQLTFQKPLLSKKAVACVAAIEKRNEFLNGTPNMLSYEDSLAKYAKQSELIALTRHPHAVVRSYAFGALCYDSAIQLLPYIVQHISDTARVVAQYGCIRHKEPVGDVFISQAYRSERLTSSEKQYIDSVLIYTPNSLNMRYSAIDSARTTENLYPRLRELVIKEQNGRALLRLAEYRREQDIPLILGFHEKGRDRDDDLFYIYTSISRFPHPTFSPFLQEAIGRSKDSTHYDSQWYQLYAAVASYQNDTALAILQQQMTKDENPMRKYYMGYLFNAALSFYTPIYDTLLWNLWANEKEIDTEAFYLLYPKNPDRAAELTRQTIQEYNDYYFGLEANYSRSDIEARWQAEYPGNISLTSLLEKMLDTLTVRNRQEAIHLVNENLRTVNIHAFPIFLRSAQKLDMLLFSHTLTKRLMQEDNFYVFADAIPALSQCNNAAITQQLTAAYRKNRVLGKDNKKHIASLLKAGGFSL